MQNMIIQGTLVETGNATLGRGTEVYSYALFGTNQGERIKVDRLAVSDELSHYMKAGETGKFVLGKLNGWNCLFAAETSQGAAVDPNRAAARTSPIIWVLIIAGFITSIFFVGVPFLLLGLLMLFLDKRNKRNVSEIISRSGITMQPVRQF